MAEKGFWGIVKISWRTTGLQNLVYHPLIICAIFVGPVLHPAHWTYLIAGLLSGIYHEWTQADAGEGRPNLLERIIDVLGHGFGGEVIWWAPIAIGWLIGRF